MRFAIALIAVAGCTTSEPFEPSPPVTPPGPLPPAWQVSPRGTYHITTSLELTPGDLVDADGLTATLRGFTAHPGATLIALADEAHDPAIAVLRADLSAADLQAVAGWIDAAMSPQGKLVVLGLEYGVSASMKKLDLESELVFTGGIARHHLVAVTIPAYQRRFELGGEPGELLEAMPRISTEGAGLELGEHELAIGVGAYAWDAVDAQSDGVGGIRGALGTATQCNYIALEVALHVAHVTEIQQLCERGLDRVVAHGRAEAAVLKLATLRFERGNVGMDDADLDHVADGFFGGVWTASATAGGPEVSLSPTFE